MTDNTIDIAVGRSRRETSWKNKRMAWPDLVQKLSVTHHTAETYQEYVNSKKPRQDEIKDIGGFVGGYLVSGKRRNGSVAHRQLITLDLDYANISFWSDFELCFNNAAVVYSTHKHCAENPRLRLVMPMDREVFADEYEAIARRVAGILGIELFDPTTFQPERLMYWPSTAKDGEFYFQQQDGPWLCADDMLSAYRDWKDTSEWPVSERVNKIVFRNIQKQGDPLEKPGIVGAFCRAYTIHEAIAKFLPTVYEACEVENRYTYLHGSTAAGLITYDDKFAYSHHGTDPTSGRLCNAFDLVRIHLYGLKDEDAKEGTAINKLPSYIAMSDFAAGDTTVRKLRGVERLQEAGMDFAEPLADEDGTGSSTVVDIDWLANMAIDRKGNYLSTIDNIILILQNDLQLKGCFAFNDFEKREVALRNLPWRKITGSSYLTDTDDAGLAHYLEKTYDISHQAKTHAAVLLTCHNNAFHPIRDFLSKQQWDGHGRLDTMLIDYLGAEDCEYVRAVTRKTFTAAVARVFNPGIKFDYVLTLAGPEGLGKSSLIRRLSDPWFSDSLGTVVGKEAFEQVQGVWMLEMAELERLNKAEVAAVKNFVSKQEDRYRVAYGKRVENFPRQCVFIGTTNEGAPLRGSTGNRRWWVVDVLMQQPVCNVFTDLDAYEIGQIWAEAVARYKEGEPLYLDARLEAIAKEIQSEHTEQDERTGIIAEYLDKLLPEGWEDLGFFERRAWLANDDAIKAEGKHRREKVCITEIWCECLGGKQEQLTKFNTKELHDIMNRMQGWHKHDRKVRFRHYGVQRAYTRIKINAPEGAEMLP
ncbi:MAG: hypothetical protein EBX40_00660 [Gammaproteobacteria bacterium]|nr:hypothetical protein [Gammaproteobacteria bacterium]